MYTTPLNCPHSQVLSSIMAARTDPHTLSVSWISHMYTVIILQIWRDILVCMSLCVYVWSSQEYFVHPITLLHQTVQGAGSDTHSWCNSASSWLHCWVHFKDQTWCRRHDRITCGSLCLRHGKHGGPEVQSKFYKTNGRNSIFQNITKKPPKTKNFS